MLDADIEAAFDNVSHGSSWRRSGNAIKDKRVLALVKAFLKAGVLTDLGDTGTPHRYAAGGICPR